MLKTIHAYKTEKREKFLKKLEEQNEPLSEKQFKKLLKMLPSDKLLSEWMVNWSLKNQDKQNVQNQEIQDLLVGIAESLKKKELPKVFKEEPEKISVQEPKRKNILKWMSSATVACVLCLAIVLPIALCGHDKEYSAWNARILGLNEGVYFNELYSEIKADEDLIIFNQIMNGKTANIEVYDDETEELLSYVLYDCNIDASTGGNIVAFKVDYRIRFVNKYLFAGWDTDYASLKNIESGFRISGIEIKYATSAIKIEGNETTRNYTCVFMTFSYGKYDYFLKITPIEIEGVGIITPLTEVNLILMMTNLLF